MLPGGDGSDVGAYELQVPSALITAGPAEERRSANGR